MDHIEADLSLAAHDGNGIVPISYSVAGHPSG